MLQNFAPKALLALPRTGSSWFANCLFGEKDNWEFFNPAVNSQFYKNFGGNRCWWMLFQPLKDKEKAFIQFKQSGLKAVKECWACGKLDFFRKYFNCFGLIRETELTFPGKSFNDTNVVSYQAYYAALIYHKNQLPFRTAIDLLYRHGESLSQKICGTHVIVSKILEKQCGEFNIPVYDYRKLVTLKGVDLENYTNPWVAQRILDTRQPRLDEEPFNALGIKNFIEDLRVCCI